MSNQFIIKIDDKSLQLKTTGTTRGDLEILKTRLKLIWAEPAEQSDSSATTWRRNRARRGYLEVQAVDNHLFLAFILVIPPTECTKKSIDDVIGRLTCLESYESYRLNLSPALKKVFESIAVEQGFTSSRNYLDFMHSLFPQRENRQIQFAYSLIRLEDIPAFFEMILKGIPSSKQVKEEVAQGVKTSSCVTVFVPTGQKDGTCNIIIDRNTLMEAITKFQLSDVML